MAKKLTRHDPRDLPGGSWYYIHPRTIEVYAYDENVGSATVMLGEPHLRKMLAELTPPKKRAAPKPRKVLTLRKRA